MTKDGVQSSAIIPQWPLIIFAGSLVVRMMDALMVVKQCCRSLDWPVTLNRVAALSRRTSRILCIGSDAALEPDVVFKVLLKWSHAAPLQCSTAVHGAENVKDANTGAIGLMHSHLNTHIHVQRV